MARVLMILPPVVFFGLAGLLYVGLQREAPNDIPSAFLEKPAPILPDQPLGDLPLLTGDMLRGGEVTVVNFWASWCPPCRAEHPVLLDMAAKGIKVVGINMMDDDAKALAYLAEEGNPFAAVGADPKGQFRLEWGVTAPPETFIIRGDGTIAFRFIGPLMGTDYEARFLPALNAALGGS